MRTPTHASWVLPRARHSLRARAHARPRSQGHRDGLSALAFGGASKELFTAARDRTVKLWNLSEMAYVETLFGHADEITALDALSGERAVSCGTDRSVRLWKVHEETQLVFHGHSAAIDCVRMLTPSSFVTGSQDGVRCRRRARRRAPRRALVARAPRRRSRPDAPCTLAVHRPAGGRRGRAQAESACGRPRARSRSRRSRARTAPARRTARRATGSPHLVFSPTRTSLRRARPTAW